MSHEKSCFVGSCQSKASLSEACGDAEVLVALDRLGELREVVLPIAPTSANEITTLSETLRALLATEEPGTSPVKDRPSLGLVGVGDPPAGVFLAGESLNV